MIRRAILLAVLVAVSSPAFATMPAQGTPQEQAACRSDVRKYCHAALRKPDATGGDFLICLQANRAKLKPACRFVLESHGQ